MTTVHGVQHDASQASRVEAEKHSLANERLREFYRERGFANRVGFGERPAILVIDLARAWTDPSSPIGTDLSGVIAQTRRILRSARAARVPVFFTTMAYEADLRDLGEVIAKKKPLSRLLVRGSPAVELIPELEVRADEVVITKQRGSAFFGTSLLSLLIGRRIDTVIVTGCSTSGCIRATAHDAHDYNLHVIVPLEAVGDRSATAHEANLFDIDARLGDVLPVDDVLGYLEGLGTRGGAPRG